MYTTTYNVAMKKPRMTAEQISRLGRLLWMQYKPSEISDEIGCSVDTIYKSFLPAGCPHERDEHDQIWIVGTEFARWARDRFIRKATKTTMGRDQAYCMRCRRPVDVIEMMVKQVKQNLEMVSGKCALCGASVYRARSGNGQS